MYLWRYLSDNFTLTLMLDKCVGSTLIFQLGFPFKDLFSGEALLCYDGIPYKRLVVELVDIMWVQCSLELFIRDHIVRDIPTYFKNKTTYNQYCLLVLNYRVSCLKLSDIYISCM